MLFIGVALLLAVQSTAQPVFTIVRNGTTYLLNSGLCESYSCGSDEGRGSCANEIYRGRAAHYCQCNLPFTGQFCGETLRLNTSLLSSVYFDCPLPLFCASVYGDGHCNQECNTPECLYDGYECLLQDKCPDEDYCRDRFSDGVCDDACMSEECEYDGGDCFGELDTLPGQLMIRLSMTAQDFMPLSHLFLFQLSRFLRATVVLSQDALGPLMWQWSSDAGRGSRIGKGENSSVGIEVAFSVDLTRCTSDCFDSISRVAQFIEQALVSKAVHFSSALSSVVSVSSDPFSSPSHIRSEHIILSVGVLFLLFSVLIGMTLRLRTIRKRVIEASDWYPPAMGEVALAARPIKRARRIVPAPSALHIKASGTDRIGLSDLCDVNRRDDRGRTPLLLVVQSQRRDEATREAVEMLIRGGADINAVDDDGWGVLHHSLHRPRTPAFHQWLMELGASATVVDVRGRSVLMVAIECMDLPNLTMLLNTAAKDVIDVVDDRNRTALSIAVSDCQLDIARALVDHGANINNDGEEQFDPSIMQRYPLHCAVQSNNKEHVRLLINRGCLMDIGDTRKRTPLHYAVLYADVAMCRLLVDGGVPVDSRDDEDRTAEDIARAWNLVEILEYLFSVRGRNETRRKRKAKRSSSDQGYGSEESERSSADDVTSSNGLMEDSAPLPPLILSPPKSFGIPQWATDAQLPMFHTTPLTPLARLAASTTGLHTPFPQVLTPSHTLLQGSMATPTHMLHGSSMSLQQLQQPALYPYNYLTPL